MYVSRIYRLKYGLYAGDGITLMVNPDTDVFLAEYLNPETVVLMTIPLWSKVVIPETEFTQALGLGGAAYVV